MSIKEFQAVTQSFIFKDWLKNLDKNIVNSTAKDIRSREQQAAKTDFILSVADVKRMYSTVTNKKLSTSVAKRVLRDIAQAGKLDIPAKVVKYGRSGALFFESIGFDSITNYVTSVFDQLNGVKEGYQIAGQKYLDSKLKEIKNTKYARAADQQEDIKKAEKAAASFGFGSLLHKGHVISIATNSTKAVRDELIKASEFTEGQKTLLLQVLDKYIAKLEKDDIASSNLYGKVGQELYASYIKNPYKYLVEIQLKTDNLESGSSSLPIANELRKVFSASGKELENILSESPRLGRKLLESKGSPSYLEILTQELVSILKTGKSVSPTYKLPKRKVADRPLKVVNKSNKTDIAKLKSLKAKIKSSKKIQVPTALSILDQKTIINLPNLLNLINANLHDQIQRNMGTGNSRDVLNYRTGRFAESVKVERLSESRQGMITAFYSYMKNPYATFSKGGRQQYPRSRDPKTLITKSIREIAQTMVTNQLRAVNV
jgi:hypothetical protein